MEETIKTAKLSTIALTFTLIKDFFACIIFIGFVWFPRDLIRYFNTKLEITNRRIRGKVGLVKTNELDSPLNKINSVQIKQGFFGKLCNYGTIIVTTASSYFEFAYINNPSEFKSILNTQIDTLEETKMDMQAKKIADEMKK